MQPEQTSSKTPQWGSKEQHMMQQFLHWLLIVGIGISTFLLLVGLLIAIVTGQPVPDQVPPFSEVIPQLLAFTPTGFLTLGMLVLIATPILRVFGSVLAFLYERDWRYAGITFVVFLIVIASIIVG